MPALEWLLDNALHLFSCAALRVLTPLEAHALIQRTGEMCAPVSSLRQARELESRLGRRGSCLSRSLTVAARYRGSEVVLGVAAHRVNGTWRSSRWSRASSLAHAWVESCDGYVGQTSAEFRELARLPSCVDVGNRPLARRT
jgi:hypothetical protein